MNSVKKSSFKYLLLAVASFVIAACHNVNVQKVKVMLEDGEYVTNTNTLVLDKGSDFTFNVVLDINKIIVDTSYDNYSISESLTDTKRFDTLTFHNVNYPMVVSLSINDAVKITYQNDEITKDEYVNKTHERINTNNDYATFDKSGYALVGWKNDDEIISLGSRVSVNENLSLEAIYQKETDTSLFAYENIDNTRLKIKKYLGSDSDITIPQVINDHQVIQIDNNAFNNLNINQMVLPKTLSIVSDNAFNNCHINNLIFYDNLSTVSDVSFNDTVIDHIRINACKQPTYIKSYFGTYADKVDRLISIKDKKKIVLYSGSSTRFGFDSELIDKTFLDYEVVNMGVFAYTVSYPQVEVISNYVNKEDVLIASPEFDAIEQQINLLPKFDKDFIAMCEANYDILSILGFNKYQNFFSSFKEYQTNRSHLEKCSYVDSPNKYDEDGNQVTSPSYNRYGDYVIYRKNNEELKSFGVKRAFYNKKYFPKEYIDNFNNCFALLSDKKVSLYYDYSPRMDISISDDSDSETINELDIYLKENIKMQFISSISTSLMSPLYFCGTDNHLSTEGVNIRTKRVINELLFILNI